jgi:serine/threonine protein kinase
VVDDVASSSERVTEARMRPRQFGKYTLLEKIGSGGMAEIFKAVARGAGDFQKVLVVKRILLRFSKDPSFVKMFKDEAQITAPLQHANIVSIYEFDEVEGQYYLAMEFVNGVDLQAVMARANKLGMSVPVPVALFIVGEICKALWYAYNARDAYGKPLKIIHRDVSPSNILISYDGEVKVTDFGVAKASTSKGETQSGVLKGKLGYMSPEMVLGRDIDNRSDIFSLGIILFELITLKRMFLGRTDLQTLINIRDADVNKRLARHAEIEIGVAEIIRKALAREPEDRYASAQDFLDDIQNYMFSKRQRISQAEVSAAMKELFAEKVERELLPLAMDDITGVDRKVSYSFLRNASPAAGDSHEDEPLSVETAELAEVSEPGPEERADSEVRFPENEPEEQSSGEAVNRFTGEQQDDSSTFDIPMEDKPAESDAGPSTTRNTKLNPGVAQFKIKDSSGNIFGPVSFDNLLSLLKSRALTEDEVVSVDDGPWMRLGDFTSVQKHLGSARPTIDRSRLLFEGTIDRRMMVRTLSRICRKQALTGLLVLKRGASQKEIFFSKGRPRAIFSNLKSELLGEYLVKRDVVARNKLAQAIRDVDSVGGRLGDSLIAHGAVGSHELALFLSDQFKERFLEIFDWEDGWFGFFEDVKIPAGVFLQDIDGMELISTAVRNRVPAGMINAWMSEHTKHRLIFNTDSKVTLDDIRLAPKEMRVVNLLGARDTITMLLDGLPQTAEWAATVNRVVYILLETGVFRFRSGGHFGP